MCLDVLGCAPLHGVHTHCPYSNTVVKYKDINHHKTSDTECAWRFQGMHPYIVYTLIVRAQKDLFFVLLLNCVLLPCYCRATAVLLSQLPPTYSLIHSLHHRTTLHALHAGANRCTNRGNARGNACKSHRRLFKASAYEAVMTLTLKAL